MTTEVALDAATVSVDEFPEVIVDGFATIVTVTPPEVELDTETVAVAVTLLALFDAVAV